MIPVAETVIVGAISMALGAGIMKLALRSKKVQMLVDRSEKKKYATMNDPDLLLENLNKNGIMVDDGDEISFAVEEKDGKKQLVQTIKTNVAPKGIPKVAKTPSNKKDSKKGENKDGKKG